MGKKSSQQTFPKRVPLCFPGDLSKRSETGGKWWYGNQPLDSYSTATTIQQLWIAAMYCRLLTPINVAHSSERSHQNPNVFDIGMLQHSSYICIPPIARSLPNCCSLPKLQSFPVVLLYDLRFSDSTIPYSQHVCS